MTNLNRAFLESWGDIVDRSEPYFDDIASGYQRAANASTRRDRSDGRFLPVYDNEVDLQIIRAMARLLHERVPMAKAKTRRLVDYTISRGFDWLITHESPGLERSINREVTRFLDENHWTVEGERDSFKDECVDGEFVAELDLQDGDMILRWLTGDNLVEPYDPRSIEEWKKFDVPMSWSFGVGTPENLPSKPRAYHVVRNESYTDWDVVPLHRMVHWRRNVPVYAKRGFSDHYTIHVYLGRADKVLANTAEGAAVQSAIAYIVEHLEGTTGRQAANVVNNLLNVTGRDPVTGAYQQQKKIKPGQRLDIPAGMKYHAGLFGSSNNDIYIQVMESLVRLSGTPEAFPEHMLTGFAGNNNMASSLTAESPFVQGRLADQAVRKMRKVEFLLKVIRLAWEAGRFRNRSWDEIKDGLDIQCTEPSIVTRDPLQLTQALAAQKAEGWLSDRSASQELGLDFEEEQQARKDEAENPIGPPSANAQAQGGGPGGPPGAPDGPPGEGGGGPAGMPGMPPTGADESAPVPGVGGMAGLSRMQYKRNKAAINDILTDVSDGVSTPEIGKVLLKALGLTSDEAGGLIDSLGKP
jgi:hypothetical protein